mgnify:CR=1 FL=1
MSWPQKASEFEVLPGSGREIVRFHLDTRAM